MTNAPDLFLRREAQISPCGQYRFSLRRSWDDRLPAAAWLMLNPSTADHEQDDPTIRRVIHFSRQNGCGSAIVVNLWPIRTPYPRDLWPAIDTIPAETLEANFAAIEEASATSSLHIAAFGADAGRLYRRHVTEAVGNRFLPAKVKDWALRFRCLGTTSDGWPLHPLARGKFAIPNTRHLNGWNIPR